MGNADLQADAAELEALVARIFSAAGSEAGEAAEIAAHLVKANLAGHDSHGIGVIPTYLEHLAAGLVKPNQVPIRVGGEGVFAIFDGQMGYGQPVANVVMREAAAIAAWYARGGSPSSVADMSAAHSGVMLLKMAAMAGPTRPTAAPQAR